MWAIDIYATFDVGERYSQNLLRHEQRIERYLDGWRIQGTRHLGLGATSHEITENEFMAQAHNCAEEFYENVIGPINPYLFFGRGVHTALWTKAVALFEKITSRPIVVWNPMCDTGDTAHSLVMLAKHHGHKIKVIATDGSHRNIAQAKLGIYQPGAVQAVPDEMAKYLEDVPGGYRVTDAIQSQIKFQQRHLTDASDDIPCDIIAARNIYKWVADTWKPKLDAMFTKRTVNMISTDIGSSPNIGSPGWGVPPLLVDPAMWPRNGLGIHEENGVWHWNLTDE